MRAVVSTIAALLVTLALFYLMHLMISGHARPLSRPETNGVVEFVRLERAGEEPGGAGSPDLLPERAPLPASLPPPASATPAETPSPAEPELAAETPEPPPVELSERPFLGPLIATVKKPPPARQASPRPAKPSTDRPSRGGASAAPAKGPAGAPGTGGSGAQTGGMGRGAPGTAGSGAGGDGDIVALLKIPPIYPRKAAMQGKEGWVKVAFTITESGTVSDAVVVESKPRRVFDSSAITAIRKWRFKPMVVDGKAVPRRATQVIDFKLAGN
jgi:protein TonB